MIRLAIPAFLYAVGGFCAICVAGEPDRDEILAARHGDLRKLAVHEDPRPVPDTAFETSNGTVMTLQEFRGKAVVLNFWATWCAPCRKEMPSLDRLQAHFGKETLEVVAVAVGFNAPQAVDKFLEEAEIRHLSVFHDPKQALARTVGVLGLPVTVLIDQEGNEIARLTGDADWNSDSAIQIVSILIDRASG